MSALRSSGLARPEDAAAVVGFETDGSLSVVLPGASPRRRRCCGGPAARARPERVPGAVRRPTRRTSAGPAARWSSLPPGLLSSSGTGSRLSAHPGDRRGSSLSHERSQQEEDALRRSLMLLAAAAALPMVAGAPAAAQTPPPTPPGGRARRPSPNSTRPASAAANRPARRPARSGRRSCPAASWSRTRPRWRPQAAATRRRGGGSRLGLRYRS